jgi:transposase
MDPDQTAWMRRLLWINAGRKRIKLVLSLRGSIIRHAQKLEYLKEDNQI